MSDARAETANEATDSMKPETNPNEQDSRSLHAVLGDTAVGAAVALLDMQRALMWMEHENRLAEREEGMGGWLSDHSEAMRYWNAEYDKARAGVSPNDQAHCSATLSEAANQALCWLMGEQASRMKCGEARAAILEGFGSKVDEELKAFFCSPNE